MSKHRNRKPGSQNEKSLERVRGKRRILLIASAFIVLMLAGIGLAQWRGVFSSTQKKQSKSGELVPTSLNPQIYTKEYIYNGAQLIATDERCFTLSATSQSFADSSGPSGNPSTGSFTVTASCAWTVNTNDSFIAITSGPGGTGNGTVTFTVANNTTTAIRSGTITVASGPASQNFKIYQGIAYADVSRGDIYYTAIGKLSARGFGLSCTSGNYCPTQPLNRDEMAFLLIGSLHEPGYVPPTPTSQRFPDVGPTSNIYYAYIDEIAVRQITLGCGSGNYCPSLAIPREHMAAFIIRALHEPGYIAPTPGSQRFTDVPPSSPYYAYVEELAVRGITLGCGGGNYCPGLNVSRGDMALFLVRAFNL